MHSHPHWSSTMTRPHAQDGDEAASPSAWTRLTNAVLGMRRRRRADLSAYLLSCVVYLVSVVLLEWGGALDLIPQGAARNMSAGILVSVALFYFMLRFDDGQRIPIQNVVLGQIVLALTWIACAYAFVGEFRGITLMIMTLVQVFGMFYLRINYQTGVALYAFVVMSAVMSYKMAVDPGSYNWKTEFPYFLTMSTSLLATLFLGMRLSALRDRLKAQKKDLREALVQLEQMASHDELTGLLNRRQMSGILEQELKHYARKRQIFCLALLDLDHFKRINDTMGHGVGDEVLRNFAEQARGFVREADSLARWGGEEFLILFPQASLAEAQLALQRLQDRLQVVSICPGLNQLRLSFSAGLVEYVHGERIEQTLDRADQALYIAKSSGRARTIAH